MKTLTSLPIAFLLFTSSLICGQTTVLDTTFGNGGIVITQISSPDNIIALKEQADGKIVACGQHLVARYLANGTLDSSFGKNGIIDSLGFEATCMKQYPTGEILIGGTYNWNGTALVKFLMNGQLDTAFGQNGYVPSGWSGKAAIQSLDVQADGKVVCGVNFFGALGFPAASHLLRFNVNGTVDNLFSITGSIIEVLYMRDIFILANGMILAGGASSHCSVSPCDYHMLRINPSNGNRDSTYGVNGLASLTNSFSNFNTRASFYPDGSVHIQDMYFNPINFKFGQLYTGLNANGQEDTVFSGIDSNAQSNTFWAISVDGTGKTFSAGHDSSNFVLVRLNKFAEKDTACFPPVLTDFGGNDEAHAMIITSDGKILLAGKSDSSFALARYIDPCSGISIKEELPTASLVVFPNPSSGSFSVQFDAAIHTGQIQIYNLNGQKVYHQKIDGQNEIELKLQLPDGFYTLRLSSENTNYTQRLLINQKR